MSRVPREVDQLMWLVAEDGDPKAIDEFGLRYPDLRSEMSRRLQMVRQLRGAKQTHSLIAQIPRFEAPAARSAGMPGRLAWGIAAVALAALGFASFQVSRSFLSSPKPRHIEPSSSIESPLGPVSQSQIPPRTQAPVEPTPSTVFQQPPTTKDVPVSATRVTIKESRVRLLAAIERIARLCSLQIEIAPGMPNPEIVMDYNRMTGLEMLQDMGPRFGFTALEEGSGKLLIVPVLEGESSPPEGEKKMNGPTKVIQPGDEERSGAISIRKAQAPPE